MTQEDEAVVKELKSLVSLRRRHQMIRDILLQAGYKGIVYVNRYEGMNNDDEHNRALEDYNARHDLTDDQFLKLYPSAPVCYIVLTPSGEVLDRVAS